MDTTYRNPYIGHPSQLLRINDYVMVSGFAHGIRATDIHNGPLSLTVCADKGMDFPYLSYKGMNIGYISPSGLVGSTYYDGEGKGFLQGFFAGFLTTCGLVNTGVAYDENGRHYGLHGRVNNIPAEEYAAKVVEENDRSYSVVSGKMREAVLYGEYMTLERQIVTECGKSEFSFVDHVVNRSFHSQQHMILYHFNFGYPLLDENVELLIPHISVKPQDGHSREKLDERLEFSKPTAGSRELSYFYKLCKDQNGQTFAGIYNHNLGFGVVLEFDGNVLDHFLQWKLMKEGEYVLGLEPANATTLGAVQERNLGHVKYLEPGETRDYRFTVRILEDCEDLNRMRKRVEDLQREASRYSNVET